MTNKDEYILESRINFGFTDAQLDHLSSIDRQKRYLRNVQDSESVKTSYKDVTGKSFLPKYIFADNRFNTPTTYRARRKFEGKMVNIITTKSLPDAIHALEQFNRKHNLT